MNQFFFNLLKIIKLMVNQLKLKKSKILERRKIGALNSLSDGFFRFINQELLKENNLN